MALPYYMPPMDGYFQNPGMSVNYVHQLGYNQPSYEMPYAPDNNQGMHYGQQYYPGYQPNVAVQQPTQPYGVAGATYSQMSNMTYPHIAYANLAELAVRSTQQALFQGTTPQVSFTSQLRSAAERLAKADARANSSLTYGKVQGSGAYAGGVQANPAPVSTGNYTYRHGTPAPENLPIQQHQSKPVIVSDVVLVPPPTRSSVIPPSSEVNSIPADRELSALEIRIGSGFELALARDPSLGQRTLFGDKYKPGEGQAYISKIRAGVEAQTKRKPDPVKPQPNVERSQKRKAEEMIPERSETSGPQNQTTPEMPNFVSSSCPCIEMKKRKIFGSSGSLDNPKLPREDWYPKPASAKLDQLFLGPNKTCIPSQVYASIPWESLEDSTKILMEYIFDEKTLATHNLEGEPCLDPGKVEDIAGLVADKCFVSEKLVRSYMVTICSDKAKETQQS